MKRFFTLGLILMFAGVFSTVEAQPLKLGIKGGINTSEYDFSKVWINGAEISPVKSNSTGYQMGVVMRLQIPKFIYFQPELLYTVRDYNYQVTTDASSVRTRLNAKRLELPIMVGFNIAALRIYAGPRFILGTTVKSNNKDVPLKVDYHDSDIALQVGAGLDIRKFFVDVRYSTFPNSHFEKFTYDNFSKQVKIKNADQWFISAGFFF